MAKLLTIEDILNAPDVVEKEIDMPEWGGSVRVKTLTMEMQQKINQSAVVDGVLDRSKLQLLLFINCVVEPQFTEAHVEALRQKSAVPIVRVLTALTDLSGASKEASEKTQATFPEGVSGS